MPRTHAISITETTGPKAASSSEHGRNGIAGSSLEHSRAPGSEVAQDRRGFEAHVMPKKQHLVARGDNFSTSQSRFSPAAFSILPRFQQTNSPRATKDSLIARTKRTALITGSIRPPNKPFSPLACHPSTTRHQLGCLSIRIRKSLTDPP